MKIKEWFGVQELAGIVGLPQTTRGIRKAAAREKWTYRSRQGQGGGREYHINSLPAETQRSLRISQAKTGVNRALSIGGATGEELRKLEESKAEARREQFGKGVTGYMKLNGSGRIRSDAKQDILIAIKSFQNTSQLGRSRAIESFVALYNTGELSLESWIHETHSKLTRASVYRWIKTYEENGPAALAGAYGSRKGSGVIDSQPELKEFVIGMVVQHPHIKASVLLRAIQAQFKAPVTLPAKRTLERWVAKWKDANKQIYTAVTNPDEWKNKYMVAFGSMSEDVVALNQLWELDSTPADVMFTDGRYSIIGAIDVMSRRFKMVVSPTSNAKSVAQVIRRAILDWGVPEAIKTDNGKDYVSRHITSIVDRLNIDHRTCRPFCGWEKPHIERVFKTFQHDLVELLPGYVGHNVTDRKAIESRKAFSDRLFEKDAVIEINMTSEAFQAFCDSWIDNIYHQQKHGSLDPQRSPKWTHQCSLKRTLPMRTHW
jgi:putative transposase